MQGHARQFMNARVVVTFPHTTLEQTARELARLEISGLLTHNDKAHRLQWSAEELPAGAALC